MVLHLTRMPVTIKYSRTVFVIEAEGRRCPEMIYLVLIKDFVLMSLIIWLEILY